MGSTKPDEHHLRALIERLGEPDETIRGGIYPKIRPLITIEQFFKGSNGNASMWFNQFPAVPGEIDELAFWRSLRDRSEVWDVLISATQIDFNADPFEEGSWVYSDHVVVITDADADTVLSWFPEEARPEFVGDEWAESFDSEVVFVPKGMKPLWFWYD